VCTAVAVGLLAGAGESASAVTITDYGGLTAGSQPYGITGGPDGNVWFTEFTGSGLVGRITPAGVVSEFASGGSQVQEITSGPDGNLWVTAPFVNDGIRRITPSGAFTVFALPGTHPVGITTGSDNNLWFTEFSAGKIAKITTSGTITGYPAPPANGPTYITTGPDGNLWVTFGNQKRVMVFDPATGAQLHDYGPLADYPRAITTGPDGNLWFVESFSGGTPTDFIGRMSVGGTLTEFGLGTNAGASGIVAGPDGNLWFTENLTDKIGRITPSGAITEFPLAAGSGPNDIALGPDGNLWFTEGNSARIGRISDIPPPSSSPPPSSPPTPSVESPPTPGGLAEVTPVITGLRISPRAFRAATHGGTIAAATTGARVSYNASVADVTTFEVQRRATGVRVGKRCAAKTKVRSRGKKRCTRYVSAGSFDHPDAAGANSFRFTGRTSSKRRVRTLPRGRYRLRATPRLGSQQGSTVSVGFRIKP
jgi:streptogramin lyase